MRGYNKVSSINFDTLVKSSQLRDSVSINDLHKRVVQFFIQEAVVKNPEKGYVFCAPLNHLVNARFISAAALVANSKFINKLHKKIRLNKIIGVCNRGKEFGMMIADILNIPNCVTDRKYERVQELISSAYDVSTDILTIRGIPSFTQGGTHTHIIRGLRPGDKALIVDDFCARGESALSQRNALMKHKITLYHVFLAAKDFTFLNPPQIGYRTLKEQGVPAYAVVRLTGYKGNTVIATAQDIE